MILDIIFGNSKHLTDMPFLRNQKRSIDFTELERHIEQLSKYHYVKINQMDQDISKHHSYLEGKVALLYDSEDYSVLYDLIRKHFSSIKSIEPGTIGAWCYGNITI